MAVWLPVAAAAQRGAAVVAAHQRRPAASKAQWTGPPRGARWDHRTFVRICRRLQQHIDDGSRMPDAEVVDAAKVVLRGTCKGAAAVEAVLASYLLGGGQDGGQRTTRAGLGANQLNVDGAMHLPVLDLETPTVVEILRAYTGRRDGAAMYNAAARLFSRRGWRSTDRERADIVRILRLYQKQKLHIPQVAKGMVEQLARANVTAFDTSAKKATGGAQPSSSTSDRDDNSQRSGLTPFVWLLEYSKRCGLEPTVLDGITRVLARGEGVSTASASDVGAPRGALPERLHSLAGVVHAAGSAVSSDAKTALMSVIQEARAALPRLPPSSAARCMTTFVVAGVRIEPDVLNSITTLNFAEELSESELKGAARYAMVVEAGAACEVLASNAAARARAGRPTAAAHVLRDFVCRRSAGKNGGDGRDSDRGTGDGGGSGVQWRSEFQVWLVAEVVPRLHAAVADRRANLMTLLADADASIAYAEGVTTLSEGVSAADFYFLHHLAVSGSIVFCKSARALCLTHLVWAYQCAGLLQDPEVRGLCSRVYTVLCTQQKWRRTPLSLYRAAVCVLSHNAEPHEAMIDAVVAAFAAHGERLPLQHRRAVAARLRAHQMRCAAVRAAGAAGGAPAPMVGESRWRGSQDALMRKIADAWHNVL